MGLARYLCAMFTNTIDTIASDLESSFDMIYEEQRKMREKLSFRELSALVHAIQGVKRIYVVGAGRSGLALRAAAMRLMHLGLTVFVAGETTTPAIGKGDLLLAASGSGTTGSIVKAGEKAVAAGAQVIALSTTREAPLAKLATFVIVLPAAQKQDFQNAVSSQYAGSLFEQGILLVTDAVFHTLWKMVGTPAEELWKRHANLE